MLLVVLTSSVQWLWIGANVSTPISPGPIPSTPIWPTNNEHAYSTGKRYFITIFQ